MGIIIEEINANNAKDISTFDGNITPVREYNFWADRDAAKIVFESGMRIIMVGWDISRTYAVLNHEDTARHRRADGQVLCGYPSNLSPICHDPIQTAGF